MNNFIEIKLTNGKKALISRIDITSIEDLNNWCLVTMCNDREYTVAENYLDLLKRIEDYGS